ncbi:bifunctional (p)ppGpp synthetase/guanosine-3',5'-bis(diphosphate) 3'-pyrophosphohydrolase [Eubacteriales bacterium OttesenSCG-928-N13]|nr:bifunctional (p)ppGpp synthetase/guanosine-3',5'-bis(diphosphate) 3'-pyrophosphohydrolase [Eubacteriales bacterium OttesenSCG-928-N13]
MKHPKLEPIEQQGDPQLQALLQKIRRYHPDDDLNLVERAYLYAQNAHAGQKRKNGKPYFTHPYRVADILAEMMLDATTIAAGLLHDCVEDVPEITVEKVDKEFGAEVAALVDGVTKLSKLDFTSKEEQQAESLRKMFLAMAKDIRVVLIKLADRLHNMRTLKFQSPERQLPIARETLDIYAPLAHRMGISTIKWELEDTALRYIDPEGYYHLVELVGMKREEREKSIVNVVNVLDNALKEQGLIAEIDGRPKHFYSIYKKMKNQGKNFDQIYDLIAIRVIVDTIPDCYTALGVVHTLWTQVPNRFKDYISMPKANMYQSLHTTVVGMRGLSFEVQIRTREMHRTAEFGIAAHWRYKEGKQADTLDNKLYWLRQILDWQNETRDPGEFMDALKMDLFSDEVFVFTPKGDVISLPKGATPIDFAYAIHTAIGNKCVGAKVDGRIVPLNSELQSGDFVEVMTSSSSRGPSRDWLQVVKTSEARSKIRAWFKHEFKDENRETGRDLLEKEAKRLGYSWSQLHKPEYLEPVYKRYTLNSLDDLYITVGFGGISAPQILNRLIEEYKKATKPESPEIKPVSQAEANRIREDALKKQAKHSSHGVVVEGEGGMLVRFAKCCSPLPGDDIVGYITRGRGVSVHRSDCVNMADFRQTPERLIDVSWEGNTSTAYNADIQIVGYDRMGLLADISMLFNKMEVSIVALSARVDKNHHTVINVSLGIQNTEQLEKIIKQLLKRQDIIEVFRTST